MASGRQLLGLLLLCFALTVNGESSARPPREPCTRGIDAVTVFIAHPGCRGLNDAESPRYLLSSIADNITVDNIRRVFTNYCSGAFPDIMECFQQNIQNCSADERSVLTRVASQTGFVCQPNSTVVHPRVLYLLSKLSDDQVADNPDCGRINRSIHEECELRAAASVNLLHGAPGSLASFTISQLAAKIQKFYQTNFECFVEKIRDNPNRCPQWRRQVFQAVTFGNIFPSKLGRNMTFTNAQLNEMFEIPASDSIFQSNLVGVKQGWL